MSALGHKRTHAAQQKDRYSITSSARLPQLRATDWWIGQANDD
jgi:hypothetical protein